MQVYPKSNKAYLKTILVFTAILFVAFLPISTFLFSLKNDAFTNYFPAKFFISESIKAGYLPLWNPYINFGFPQYGDMNAGYWSPITWLIAATVGYNAYTFTLETLLYILLSGVGMYMLTGFWKLDEKVRFIAAIAFMCSGYNIGHLQHFNWLSGAAFIPWFFWSYLLLLNKFSAQHCLQAVLLFYLLVASAHPGIIISAAYFFLCVSIFFLSQQNGHLSFTETVKKWSISNGILLLLFLLISIGMIVGYLDIIPFFLRGEKVNLIDSLLTPTTFQSWMSVLFPFSITKNDAFFNTDISMRNCYFSLTLLLFIILACFNQKNNWQKFLLVIGSLFVLLSTGGIFKTFAYKFIPFIGYVRLNGEFRIFSLLCFIIVAAIELDKFILQKTKFEGAIKRIFYVIAFILSTLTIFGLYKGLFDKQSFIFINNLSKVSRFNFKLKALIDSITFYDTLWIQGLLQVTILFGIGWCIKFCKWNLLKKILIVDMIIASLLNIPFTGVGKASLAQVQTVLNQSPKGIPLPTLQPIKDVTSLSISDELLVGNWSMYNKQIGVINQVSYPIILKNMNAYFTSIEDNKENNFLNKPFIFIENSNERNKVSLTTFSPNKITVAINTESATELVLQQNFYPYWFYETKSIKLPVNKAAINFMSASIIKSDQNVVFTFEPTIVKRAMLFSLIILIIYILLLPFLYVRNRFNRN